MKSFDGKVNARIIEARFALSGKIASVPKHTGDIVKKGQLIASLDRKILQAELDRQLADFEKVRADFEIFAQKYPDPKEATEKYLKTEKQATLNASVKEVELAKAKLDQCDLFSPVDGIIIDDSAIIPGLYITPASSSVKIADSSSFYFEVEIKESDIKKFKESKGAEIKIPVLDLSLKSLNTLIVPDGKKFYLRIPITDENLLPGLSGKVKI